MELLDLSNQKFGRLTVIKRAENRITPNGTKRTMWLCQCECGKQVVRNTQNLRSCKYASCGCWKAENTSQRKLIDLTGQRFGRLVVIKRSQNTENNQLTRWLCRCDCGNEIVAFGNNLKRGHTTSCGCYREEERVVNKTTHGYRHTRIYSIYSKMKSRCYNTNDRRYKDYGGRGITICDEWYNNPISFIEWAFQNGYKEDVPYVECTIDRIDNNKGYSPQNCRFTTVKVQSNNRRTNHLITHNGETKTLAQWRDYFGITQSKAYYHLVEKGRTIQELIDKGIV